MYVRSNSEYIYTYIESVYVVCMLGVIVSIYIYLHIVSVCGMYVRSNSEYIYTYIESVYVVCMLGVIVSIYILTYSQCMWYVC